MKKFKQFIKKFFLIDDTPQKIAGGAALGMFMGMFPGEGVLSTLFFSTIFRLNRLAALAGVFAFNMWTTFLLLPPSVAIGSFLFQKNSADLTEQFSRIQQADSIKKMLSLSLIIFSESAIPILVGYLITTVSLSVGFYFLLFFILKRRKIKHLQDSIK